MRYFFLFSIHFCVLVQNNAQLDRPFLHAVFDPFYRWGIFGTRKLCSKGKCENSIQLCNPTNTCITFPYPGSYDAIFVSEDVFQQFLETISSRIPKINGDCFVSRDCYENQFCARINATNRTCHDIPSCEHGILSFDVTGDLCSEDLDCESGSKCVWTNIGLPINKLCCRNPRDSRNTSKIDSATSNLTTFHDQEMCLTYNASANVNDKSELCPDGWLHTRDEPKCMAYQEDFNQSGICPQLAGTCFNGYCCSGYNAKLKILGNKPYVTNAFCKPKCPLPDSHHFTFCDPILNKIVVVGMKNLYNNEIHRTYLYTVHECTVNRDCPMYHVCTVIPYNNRIVRECHPNPLWDTNSKEDVKLKVYIPFYLAGFQIVWVFIIMAVMKRGL